MSQTTSAAPTDEMQQGLTGSFIAIQSANKAIKLQGTVPQISLPGLGDVNTSLTTAQGNAELWEKTISANVQNQLQAVIDYNSLYSALASSINSAITDIKNATTANPPSAATMTNLGAELAALQSQVQAILYGAGGTSTQPLGASILGTYNQMVDYQGKVGTDASVFDGYRTLAYNTKTGISQQIQDYNSDIAADRSAMAKDRAMIGGGAAMIVTGVLICVVAVALAPETGGATVAAIGTLGVATIAGGAVMIGLSSSDLDKKEADVSAKLIAIANDQSELVDLTTIGNTSANISQHAGDIFSAMNTLLTNWQQMDNNLGNVVSALNLPEAELMTWIANQPGGSNPSYFVMGTILNAQFTAPQADWANASATATQLLSGLASVVEFTLPQGTVPTSATIAAHSQKAVLALA
jgi:hypothetical protein